MAPVAGMSSVRESQHYDLVWAAEIWRAWLGTILWEVAGAAQGPCVPPRSTAQLLRARMHLQVAAVACRPSWVEVGSVSSPRGVLLK